MMRYHVKKLADLDHYSEGPVKGAGNSAYVTTLTGGKILRVESNGEITAWAEGDCPNGQVRTMNGEHWVCESQSGRVAAYDERGRFIRFVIDGACGGVAVQTPNDLLLDREENLYFTDSIREVGKVFFRANDGQESCLAEDIDYANGIALSGDQSRLYVAESYANRIRVYSVLSPGNLAADYSCIDLPVHPSLEKTSNLPDGLAVDHEDRLWVAHYGMQAIQVVGSDHRMLFSIDTELPLTSNLAFMKDTPSEKQLLVTGGYGEPGPGAVMLVSVFFS